MDTHCGCRIPVPVLTIQAWPQTDRPATSEKIVSPKQAKELFKSVDEILEFAQPRDEAADQRGSEAADGRSRRGPVITFRKNMKEDKDAQRLERSEIVLKKFGLLPRDFDLQTFLVALLKEQVAGYYDPKTKTVNLLNWVDAEAQTSGAGA